MVGALCVGCHLTSLPFDYSLLSFHTFSPFTKPSLFCVDAIKNCPSVCCKRRLSIFGSVKCVSVRSALLPLMPRALSSYILPLIFLPTLIFVSRCSARINATAGPIFFAGVVMPYSCIGCDCKNKSNMYKRKKSFFHPSLRPLMRRAPH